MRLWQSRTVATTETPLRDVLGGRSAQALEKALELVTVADLLRHYPRRYAERGELTDLSRLVEGEEVTVQARIEAVKGRRIPGRKLHILEVVIASGQGRASLSFFNQPWREKELLPGRFGFFAGKVTRFRNTLQLNSPDYQLLDSDELSEAEAERYANSIIAVYPAAAGVPSWTIARCVDLVLDSLDAVTDPVPVEIRQREHLMELGQALRQIHRPDSQADRARARHRLAFDEAFGVQLVLARRRRDAAANPAVPRPASPSGLVAAFAARLPFSLTDEQAEIRSVIEAELAGAHPMQRLLQGEVGSGKTVVALFAMLQVVDAGGQAALLAPTEVLAAQHRETVLELLGELARGGELGAADAATRVVLLTGSMSSSARRAALLDIASGRAGIVIGTHALIQDAVQFAELGLVVVDEQHRFGVEQRDALRAKAGTPPHLLVMTATPIPRTIAITVFGDLDVSEIHRLPAGRSAIDTTVVPVAEKPSWFDRVWQRVAEEVAGGRQAYVVCPRIGDDAADPRHAVTVDDSDDAGDWLGDSEDGDEQRPVSSVMQTYDALREGPLSGVRLGIMHGRLPTEDKAAVMAAFVAGDIDVLVATTVIEVGVNVANATVIVVMDADRFGVSQLHQLRGRIGRGTYTDADHRNYCLLVSGLPAGHPGLQRLQAIAATSDGFELARLDLEQRREGDVLGAAQSGRRSQLKLLSLMRDEDIIDRARSAATDLIEADPDLSRHGEIREFLRRNFDPDRTEYLHKA